MRFCKNLQKIIEISDTSWTPFWPNYKMLKKLIKGLPSLVPEETSIGAPEYITIPRCHQISPVEDVSICSTESVSSVSCTSTKASSSDAKAIAIAKNPGEKAFFKLLHYELKKTQSFFFRTQKEFQIREERVREGFEVMKKPCSFMVDDKWSCVAKSVYKLYKDLLLLETYAIMAYCSFSKILKKHDKVTGYRTRKAFMMRLVNKSEFVSYPGVIAMITRTESLYDEVSMNLVVNGKEGLGEDEHLFINMIHKLNSQILNKAETDSSEDCIRRQNRDIPQSLVGDKSFSQQLETNTACDLTNSIKNLVAENDKLLRPKSNDLCEDQDQGDNGVNKFAKEKTLEQGNNDMSIGKHKFSHKMKVKCKRQRQS